MPLSALFSAFRTIGATRRTRALLVCLGLTLAGVPIATPAQAVKLGDADYFWTYDGDRAGACLAIDEPADGAAWRDNYLCGARLPRGIRWSHQGPIPGLRCTPVTEPADLDTWTDNYLCLPPASDTLLLWSHAGPIKRASTRCVPFREPADGATWDDNYLCFAPMQAQARTAEPDWRAQARRRAAERERALQAKREEVRTLEERLVRAQRELRALETRRVRDPRVFRTPD